MRVVLAGSAGLGGLMRDGMGSRLEHAGTAGGTERGTFMYIGLGTLVVIVIIVLIVLFLRRLPIRWRMHSLHNPALPETGIQPGHASGMLTWFCHFR